MVTSLALAAMLVSAPADAQRRRTPKKAPVARSGAEGGLLGVKLYDSGLRVVSLYGNPDQIVPVTSGGTAAAGGGGGGRGGFGGPGGGGSGASSPTLPPPGNAGSIQPGPEDGPSREANAFQGMQRPGAPGAPQGPGGGGDPDGGGRGGPGGGGGSASTSSEFTRLIYTKSGSKFGFVLDKFNRVIQIEAIGLQNARVRTRRGIGFGSTFSQVMKAYAPSSAPDGYEVAGDQVTVKFLTRQRVAFRLTKLGTKQAHVVTGIVVAAGKG